MIPDGLLNLIRSGFALPLDGIHGEAHWARVHENGRRLAERTGADRELVGLFAYLHDSRRQNDGWDKDHGQRAAEFVRSVNGSLLALSDEKMDLLAFACAYHNKGLAEAESTVQTCWDADRLDLGRIGIRPDPQFLCTAAAQDPDVIEWAFRRSRR